MKKSKKLQSLRRAILLATAVVAVAGGGAYAVLQSQQNVLAGNTISTATANLQLSTDGSNYGNSQTGFVFNDIVPGGAAVPETGHGFYLKNAGGTPLNLKFTVTTVPSNPDNVDLSKVNVLLTTVGSGTAAQTFSLQSLLGGTQTVSGTPLANGATKQYKLQVSMASDAVTGSSASLGNIDFAFTGLAQ